MKHKSRATKRMLSLLLCTALALALLGPAPAVAAAGTEPGYRVTGTYDAAGNSLSVSIYIHDVNALVGRFALGFDPTRLRLEMGASLADTVRSASNDVVITGEGLEDSQLMTQEGGCVMFAWYVYGGSVQAPPGGYLLATVDFTLQAGVAVGDLDAATLYVPYIAPVSGDNWDCGAWIRASGLEDFKNGVEGTADCAVSFDYPGSAAVPVDAVAVTVQPTDTSASPLAGTVVFGTQQKSASSSGAVFQAVPGRYVCRVSAPNYEERVVLVTVGGGDKQASVSLRSTAQVLKEAVQSLEIGFQGEDSAERVTRDMIFPIKGEQNTAITWHTSDPVAVSEFGNVFRGEVAKDVVVTATLSKDGRTAEKQFTVHITKADVPPTPLPEEPGRPGGKPEIPPASGSSFTDLGGYAWAEKAILALADAGIIKGSSATTFSPQLKISRGAFTALLMRMLEPEVGMAVQDFADVPSGSVFYGEIMLARQLGIAQGSNNCFYPDDQITRQDMMVLTYRTLLATKMLTQTADASILGQFNDSNQISNYAREGAAAMVGAGYIAGTAADRLSPGNATSRAEAAVFLYRIYMDMTAARP